MHLFKEINGPYTVLCLNYHTDDLIDYQLHMVNQSDQNVFIKGNADQQIKYDITSLVPIEVYFKNSCQTFERQKHIIRKLIESIWTAEKYLLDASRIVLDKSYVFIDVKRMSIKLIYMPLKSYDIMIHKSMKELLLSLYFMIDIKVIEEDTRIKSLIAYLQEASFDVMVFDAMMDSVRNGKLIKKEWFKGLFKKDKTSDENLKTIKIKENVATPTLLIDERHVPINKPSFLIGRSSSLVDFAIPEALTMGRVHAELVNDEEGCYLVDINTKNGTYINGKRLISQKKYKLFSGDNICFGSKTAIFK